jgi:hypothetical protein
MARKPLKSPIQHAFLIEYQVPGIAKKVKGKAWADTYYPQADAMITLYAENVQQAIDAKGAGDMSLCSGAFCMRDPRNKEALAAAIPPGDLAREEFGIFVEWHDTRVHIAARCDTTGLPDKNFEFGHSSDISYLNDAHNGDGMKALLLLIKKNGPLEIQLKALKLRTGQSGGGNHKKKPDPTGGDSGGGKGKGKGHKRRVARINLGGVGFNTPAAATTV